jgi:hypothetical protein
VDSSANRPYDRRQDARRLSEQDGDRLVAAIDFDTFTGNVHELVRRLEPPWQKDGACREHPE